MIFVLIVLAIIYLPVLLLVFLSFSNGLQYYTQLFTNTHYMQAIGNTLLIAVVAALVATLIATMAATGILYMGKRARAITMAVNQLPVINADIVTSFALVLLFVGLGLGNFGLFKLILAHVLIALPFCLLTVLPKLRQLDANLIDAALDLGATPFKAFATVLVPQLLPAMVEAFLLGFTLSLDDFVITQYNNSGVPTISTVVYGAISRREIPNAFKALTALILLVILIVLVVMNLNAGRKRAGKALNKKVVALVTAVVLLLGAGAGVPMILNNLTPRTSVLKIYNWEDYIAIPTEDGGVDLIAKFENWYRQETNNPNFRVEYHTFTDNEELYAKIKTQHADYDVIFPSEYMVEKLYKEHLLKPLEKQLIPNYANLDETILARTDTYAVADGQTWAIPYMLGTVGILYDTAVLNQMAPKTGIDADTFEQLLEELGFGVLFGEKYQDYDTSQFKGHITMKKSARDSVGIAMLYAEHEKIAQSLANAGTDYDNQMLSDILNMQDEFTLAQAEQVLQNQIKTMNPYYENDRGKKAFADPNDTRFAYGLYWSCDAGIIMGENTDADGNQLENLKFYAPRGTNLWTDNFALPTYGANSPAAHAFINFMLDPDHAAANIDYVGSAMAVKEAVENIKTDYGYDEDEDQFYFDNNYVNTVCPTADAVTYSAIMHNFDSKQETAVNQLMVTIQNRAAQLTESAGGSDLWFPITLLVLVVCGGGIWLTYRLTHRRG